MNSKKRSQDEIIEIRVRNFFFVVVFGGFVAYGLEILALKITIFIVPMLAVFTFVVWYLFRMLNTPCPNCGKPFFSLVSFWVYTALNRKRCSHCGYQLKGS